MIYVDGDSGTSYAKRFNVTGITRDKEYDLTKGSDKTKFIILPPMQMVKRKQLRLYWAQIVLHASKSLISILKSWR